MKNITTQSIAVGWKAERVDHLRAALEDQNLDALIVPRWDDQHFEYVPPVNERLAYLTGFSGSWGLAILTKTQVILFVDGRYQEQAHAQPNASKLSIRHLYDDPPEDWLSKDAISGWRIGYDAEVISPEFFERLLAGAARSGAILTPLICDPFAAAWPERPEKPTAKAYAVTDDWAGASVTEKCDQIAAKMRALGADILVDVMPDNVNWLLNIRGTDLDYCPVTLGRILVSKDGTVDLFANVDQYSGVRDHLGSRVTLHAAEGFLPALAEKTAKGGLVLLDGAQGPKAVQNLLSGTMARVKITPSLITAAKAIKNGTELQSIERAARRDSAVWIRLLHWLEGAVGNGEAPKELDVENKMETLRRQVQDYREPSFRTISAADANGALAHYAAPMDGGSRITKKSIYLLDSGGQYSDGGTTDTTRTWCFENPPSEVLQDATLALKGHIALASQVFPEDTFGHSLDTLARMAAWSAYRDYDHGTGHGVGHFLSVHEFPQRLQKAGSAVPLKQGMIITIEPGLYKAGAYGIRHEILYEIVAAERTGWLAFKPLAFVPFNHRMIDTSLLTDHEVEWVDSYHRSVRETLADTELDAVERAWLNKATRPLS